MDSTSAVVKEENMDTSSAVTTPKVEPSSELDEPKPSPMDGQSGSNTPAASPAPPKPRQKKGRHQFPAKTVFNRSVFNRALKESFISSFM